MQLRKDIALDLIYSVIFSIVLLLTNDNLRKADPGMMYVMKNFILIAILCLWVKALSRNHASIFLIKDYPASKNSPIKSSYTLLRDFIQGKVAAFALLWCLYTFFIDHNSTKTLLTMYYELFRILMVGFYTLFVLLISVSYFKLSPSSWKFTGLAMGPYMIFFIIYAVFDPATSIYFGILPPNLGVVFLNTVDLPETTIVVGLSLILFLTMILFFIKAIKRLLTGAKFLKLDITRVN